MGASQATYWSIIFIVYVVTMGVLNSIVGLAFISVGQDNPVIGSQIPDYTKLRNASFATEFNTTETGVLENLDPTSRIRGALDALKLFAGVYIVISLPFPLNIFWGLLVYLVPIMFLAMIILNFFPAMN